ncbi:tetratricopeptide repeat protein [Photobacterium nomapromontoriensis]|uniref:tetratricopeptide repeat protein n=1 Tax=Photobacterium nomapromontoriensis TaxID=2910237 RepID=UPI003D11B4D1
MDIKIITLFLILTSLPCFAFYNPNAKFWSYDINSPNLTPEQASERCKQSLTQDTIAAAQWCTKAYALGDDYALHLVEELTGITLDQFHTMQRNANDGDIIATNRLAHFYYYGNFVDQDYTMAIQLYEKAYEQGGMKPALFLSRIYSKNNPAMDYQPDRAIAILADLSNRPYQKSILDYPERQQDAIEMLARHYMHGEIVNHDYSTAMRLFQEANKLSNKQFSSEIGYIYFHGLGVKQNYKLAFEHFSDGNSYDSVVAKINNDEISLSSEAIFYLGLIYYHGLLDEPDLDSAYQLFDMSGGYESRGDPTRYIINPSYKSELYYLLGYMLEFGLGTKSNIEYATYFYGQSVKTHGPFANKSKLRLSKFESEK